MTAEEARAIARKNYKRFRKRAFRRYRRMIQRLIKSCRGNGVSIRMKVGDKWLDDRMTQVLGGYYISLGFEVELYGSYGLDIVWKAGDGGKNNCMEGGAI